MRLYKRNGGYHVTYQSRGGKQVRRSLKTQSKQIAEQRRAKLELDLHETRLFGKEPARNFKELIANYLEAKQQLKGIVRLQYACKPLLEYFGNARCNPTPRNPCRAVHRQSFEVSYRW